MSAAPASTGWTKAKRSEAAKRGAATRKRRAQIARGEPLMTDAERAALTGSQRDRVLEGAAIGETIARAIAGLREREEAGDT